jgi:multidrug efflux pump subunit AcrB
VKAVVMPILKSAGASTLDVVARVRAALPGVIETLPKDIKLTPLFDQSVFVQAAVDGVVHEAALAAGLTALMMLLFLGSWRSTVVILVSIPLSILGSAIALGALGQSLNIMTLGGMSLAVGMLVDDATVELENIHRNLAQGKPLVTAILDGAREIAVPAFVSTLCICIVFVPVAFLTGSARSLFLPLALAVVFAMITSYVLSRTLVPTLVRYLLAPELAQRQEARQSRLRPWHERLERAFARLQAGYGRALHAALARPRAATLGFLALVAASLALFPLIGQDFFPSVDAGLIRFHARATPGTRIEETEQMHAQVADLVRRVIPAHELDMVLNNIGVTVSPINLSMGDPSMISVAGGEVLISLKPGHGSTAGYVRSLRRELKSQFPEGTFFFLAPDLSTQVLNFGISAPIDVQISGPPSNTQKNLELALHVERELEKLPGAVDVHLHQVYAAPEYRVDVDRVAAMQSGLTERDVATDLLISLSSSGQTAPNYWLDPQKGIQYLVAVQTPQYRMNSLASLESTPIGSQTGSRQLLGNLATLSRGSGPTNITHHNALPTYDVLASVDGTDLGAIATGIRGVLAGLGDRVPRGTTVRLRGQVESMESSFSSLGYGLLLAVALVYLVLVINFQSWLDPFLILTALPGALAGIAWMLFATGTTLSVPALMGTILCVGVATANSILVVTFANDARSSAEGATLDARSAALLAGTTRLRPVLMTALAMMLGMLPMAIGLGEGAEQNAPLGRAVLGGLALATLTTLFFVPVIYSLLRRKPVLRPAPEVSP